ncbi:MAG: COX15/CtaA family protein [Deltaproteobacteria bacterium]|nr:COX15/CtaA family protein [Deltaproteobacteria bacterium]
MSTNRQRNFHRLATLTLVLTLLVIAWGAFVRATGAGAGCGSHWPTCNGQIIPRAPSVKTLIEFTHRVTSGLDFLMVVALLVLSFRAFPSGHHVRRAAILSMILMVTEALIGAGLVIFEMVAGNTQIARAAWMAAHLLNTFALLAALVSTWWFSRTPGVDSMPAPTPLRRFLRMGVALLLLTATSGAVAALGDTLFPSASLAEGLAQDLSPGAHLFIRLRMWHPIVAGAVGLYLLVILGLLANQGANALHRRIATVAAALVLAQVTIGIINVVLLAPVAIQLLHLLVGDLLWMAMVVLAFESRPTGTASA